MTDGGHGREVTVVGAREYGALIEQAREAGVVILPEAEQIVVAKLVDDDRKKQPGFCLGGGRRGKQRCGAEEGENDFFHLGYNASAAANIDCRTPVEQRLRRDPIRRVQSLVGPRGWELRPAMNISVKGEYALHAVLDLA